MLLILNNLQFTFNSGYGKILTSERTENSYEKNG